MAGLWCYNQSGVTELLIMRVPHYALMCLRSVETIGVLHSQLWKRPRPLASTLSTAKNVELLGLYPVLKPEYQREDELASSDVPCAGCDHSTRAPGMTGHGEYYTMWCINVTAWATLGVYAISLATDTPSQSVWLFSPLCLQLHCFFHRGLLHIIPSTVQTSIQPTHSLAEYTHKLIDFIL